MAMRDVYSGFSTRVAAVPFAVTSTQAGISTDLLGFRGVCVFMMCYGSSGGSVLAVKLQDSADGVTWVDVPPALVQTDFPAVGFSASLAFSYRFGYLGGKRYLRPFGTIVSGTSVAWSGIAVCEPLVRPVP